MAQGRKPRLTAADWAGAALDAIGEGGLGAVAVEPLAARLGATKGSFYWHFPNRDALVTAALDLWERRHTEDVITAVEVEPDPARRLRLLFTTVIAAVGTDSTEAAVLAAAEDPLVAPVLARVTERRVSYLAEAFHELGYPPAEARRRGLLAFSAYLGHAQLVHATPAVLPRGPQAQREYVDRILDLLMAPPGG